MSKEKCTLTHLDAAAKKAKRALHKNGPKSYRKGQGALLRVLHKNNGEATRDQLIERLGFDRRSLKNIVRKAERNDYVTITNLDKGGYSVKITAAGDELAEKRCAAQSKAAKELLANLSSDEIAQLDSLLVKIVGSSDKQDKIHHKHSRKKACKRHCRH